MRLREDRHRCAHPSFHRIDEPYRPSAEQARMHLKNAITHVLSQRPVQGKAAINNIVAIVASNYFPTNTAKAITQLEKSEFSNPKISLVKNLVDKLMFGYFEDDNPLKFNFKTIAALKAVISMQRDVAETRVTFQINKILKDAPDDILVRAIGLALEIPEAACSLDQASIDKIQNFIKKGPATSVVSILHLAIKIAELNPLCEARISSLELDSLSNGILNFGLEGLAINRAISLYEQVRNWEEANAVAEKAVIPLVNLLTKEDFLRILKAPEDHDADLLGSHGFSELINSFAIKSNISIDDINRMLVENKLEVYQLEATKT